MKDVLDFVSGNFYIALCLIGVAIAVLPWLPFRVSIGGFTASQPKTMSAKVVLCAIGVVLIGVAALLAHRQISRPEVLTEPTITQYFSYVTLEGSLNECSSGKCLMNYYTSGTFETPPGIPARYVGRVKTGGAIRKFHSDPEHEVLNKEQYPNNPTLLDFAISPQKPTDTSLKIQAELVIENKITPEQGKVGFHLPYHTNNIVAMIDFRHLGFKVTQQFAARIESKLDNGALITGYVDPVLRTFSEGTVVVLQASDLEAGSSLLLTWGN